MIKTDVYDYINVLDRAADASYMRNEMIANNLANMDTPRYKRQDVAFAANLEEALKHSRYVTLDEKVDRLNMSRLRPHVYTDAENFSYRLDGNNVDPDTENTYMAENNILYNGLTQSVSAEFRNLQVVMQS
ncbi:MAG: flagellar basal body rod protein FlgB [Lachnospiraceae bacterium]|nr:flagellar basal body rod protein FlgB [Lachnospiraceae bacterium]